MRISVFITSYNQKHYLEEAIDSVLAQTLQPFEIVIVDDASTDGSQELIQDYARRYPDQIRPFCHAHNIGLPRNKNFALEQVRGELVTYLDGDDRFLPHKLERELALYEKQPPTTVIFSNFYFTDGNGRRTGVWAEAGAVVPVGKVFRDVFARNYPRDILFRNELAPLACLRQVGFYDGNFAMYIDWELRVRCSKHYPVAYCEEPLAEYRVHGGGISSASVLRHLDQKTRVYEKNVWLLDDGPAEDRTFVEQRLRADFDKLWHQAKREYVSLALQRALAENCRWQSFRRWVQLLRFGLSSRVLKLGVRVLTPTWVYRHARNTLHALIGTRGEATE